MSDAEDILGFTYDEFMAHLRDFQEKFETNIILLSIALDENDIQKFWKQARDATFRSGFGDLELLYDYHGREHTLPREDQSGYARLGRKVAGVMYDCMSIWESIGVSVAEECEDDYENLEPGRQSMDIPEEARYTSVVETGPYVKRKEKPSPKKPDRTDVLSWALIDVQPGEYICLSYPDMKSARLDQSLLKGATKRAGWWAGIPKNTVPWESWTDERNKLYYEVYLFIARLEEPKPSRRTRS